jgi:hypothetical protein
MGHLENGTSRRVKEEVEGVNMIKVLHSHV